MSRPQAALLSLGLLLGFACGDPNNICVPGNEDCSCVGGGCLPGLMCVADVCKPTGVEPSTGATDTGGTGDPTTGDAPTGDGTTGPGATTGSPTSSTGDATTGGSTGETTTTAESSGGAGPSLGFFVSSATSPTGNLGGLAGADQICQSLADAVGAGDREWRAYLSVEKGPDDGPVNARDRIGQGPWYNAKLALVAKDLAELHALEGDPELFLDENGQPINGQWGGSPAPNEHDILTGTNRDGTVTVGMTCLDWTSEDAADFAQVGHSDGLGPMMSDEEKYRPWNSVHESGGCHDTAPKGGAGRIYCFAAD